MANNDRWLEFVQELLENPEGGDETKLMDWVTYFEIPDTVTIQQDKHNRYFLIHFGRSNEEYLVEMVQEALEYFHVNLLRKLTDYASLRASHWGIIGRSDLEWNFWVMWSRIDDTLELIDPLEVRSSLVPTLTQKGNVVKHEVQKFVREFGIVKPRD